MCREHGFINTIDGSDRSCLTRKEDGKKFDVQMRFDTPQLCVLQPRGGMARSGGSNVINSIANGSSEELSAFSSGSTDDDNDDDG